ncbi:hypothetical protein LCGC14_1735450, partial [marine sediment metagenome]
DLQEIPFYLSESYLQTSVDSQSSAYGILPMSQVL